MYRAASWWLKTERRKVLLVFHHEAVVCTKKLKAANRYFYFLVFSVESPVEEKKHCMACGSTEEVQGHHVLYDPELVIPLCKSHHLLAESQSKTYHSLYARHKIGKALLDQILTGTIFSVPQFVEENAR